MLSNYLTILTLRSESFIFYDELLLDCMILNIVNKRIKSFYDMLEPYPNIKIDVNGVSPETHVYLFLDTYKCSYNYTFIHLKNMQKTKIKKFTIL